VTDDNVAVATRIYEILAALGVSRDAFREVVDDGLADPDGEVDFRGVYADAGVIHGFDEFARYVEAQPWAGTLRFEPEAIEAVDAEHVVVDVRVTASGIGSGVPVEARAAHVLTVRDGRVVRIQSFLDREAARAAVS